jgi:DNA replication and repair protein RecF
MTDRLSVRKLTLTGFRNYGLASAWFASDPVVLTGPNGAGKTNCLEAISLLTAGRGLRGVPFPELVGHGANGWAVAAEIDGPDGEMQVGTGLQPDANGVVSPRAGRTVRIDGRSAKSSASLAVNRILWLTPAMDGLFTGPAGDRRRFLDRFVLSLDPDYAAPAAVYERAMRQRNKALETDAPQSFIAGLELQMADAAIAMAAARVTGFDALARTIEEERDTESPFPWAVVTLEGTVEASLRNLGHEAAQGAFLRDLIASRERDRAAGRTLLGPHRSDFAVRHGPKDMPAKLCSTGEQKALLLGLILAQARLVKAQAAGAAPLVLLDEVAAHLDIDRRRGLFQSVAALQAQVWMTGTDDAAFQPFKDFANPQFFHVSHGTIRPRAGAESQANA